MRIAPSGHDGRFLRQRHGRCQYAQQQSFARFACRWWLSAWSSPCDRPRQRNECNSLARRSFPHDHGIHGHRTRAFRESITQHERLLALSTRSHEGSPLGLFALFSITSAFAKVSELPEHTDNFLVTYCLDCHDRSRAKGGINLELLRSTGPTRIRLHLGQGFRRTSKRVPRQKATTEADKLATIKWLEQTLLENDKPGGTILQRLSKEEYESQFPTY